MEAPYRNTQVQLKLLVNCGLSHPPEKITKMKLGSESTESQDQCRYEFAPHYKVC